MRFTAFSIPALALLSALLLSPSRLSAQGVIRGTVSDSATQEVLVGANVSLPGTALGGVTDREGRFRVYPVPAGTHRVRISYIGYRTFETTVTLSEGETVTLDRTLAPDVIEGHEVVVTAQRKGQVAAINQQVTSNTIVNVISEEKIKELPDANAAEAIGRLPGVSILRSGGEANKVILRGMDEKFTSITIDGIRVPATDPDARGVDLSMFSQGTLAGVEVFKALTPDKDADAIAGSINMVTRQAPSERTLRLDAKGAYSRLTRDASQYDFNGKYGERFFDDVLGVQLTGNLERRDRSSEQFTMSIQDLSALNAIGWRYSNLNVGFQDEVRKRGGVGLLLDVNTPDGGTIRLNNLFNQTDRSYLISSRDYPVGTPVFYSYRDQEQKLQTFNGSLRGDNNILGLNVQWGASFAESKLDYPYDYRMFFSEPSIYDTSNHVFAGMAPIPNSAVNGPPEALIPYAYNNFQKAQLDTGAYDSERNFDRDKTVFLDVARKYIIGEGVSGEIKGGGKYRIKNRFKASSEVMAPYYLNYFQELTRNADGSIVPKNFAGTRFANLQQVGRLVLLTNFLNSPPEQRGVFDKYTLNPLLIRDALRDWYTLNRNGVGASGQLEYNDNPEVDADGYDITEHVSAAYLMNTLDLGHAVTLIAGLRVESETNDYAAKYVNTPLGGFPTTGTLLDTSAQFTETIWLPNLQLTLRPLDFMSVRLAAYRALARPDFNARLEKMVARVTNPRNPLTIGNPRLKNAKAWNYEVNTSFFGNDIGLISVSAFYRQIDDMFHTVTAIPGVYDPADPGSLLDTLGITWHPSFPANSPISLTYSVNSTQPTKVWGIEFEHQASLNFLPGLLSNLVLSYNFSLIRSETFVLSYVIDTSYITIPGFPPLPQYKSRLVESKQKLEGQPEFFGNAALGYDIGGFSARVSVFHQGEFNRSYSAGRLNDPVVQSFTRWDLSVKQRLTEHITVFLNLNNLTSVEEDVFTANQVHNWDVLQSSQRYGLTGDLGIRLEL